MPTISNKAKRQAAVVKAFGSVPHLDETHYLNFLHRHRGRARACNSKGRELRHGIEPDHIEHTRKALARIRAARLVDSILD